MKLNFNNRKIADNCTFIAYSLLLVICVLGIIAIADVIFHWDILSGNAQRLAYLIIWASIVIIVSTFLISLMVNLNIISNSIENIADALNTKKENEKID